MLPISLLCSLNYSLFVSLLASKPSLAVELSRVENCRRRTNCRRGPTLLHTYDINGVKRRRRLYILQIISLSCGQKLASYSVNYRLRKMFFGVAELAAWAPPPRRTSSEVNNRPFQQSASFSWKMLMFGQPKHMLCQLEDALKTLRCVFCVHTILSGMVLIEVLHLFSTTPIPMQLAVRRPTEKSCLELTVDDFIRAPILAVKLLFV
ncbi:hypothetical protein DdX_14550 [Ditylenchus destructor]|uniref:Secreted protein n=1 Tax=Ditylenchus destructor TaxID=166010 RepID=A0AAD4MSM7_9BILA|nr:hypothetical protein DdX_14550 [Ditylenchus destructor]